MRLVKGIRIAYTTRNIRPPSKQRRPPMTLARMFLLIAAAIYVCRMVIVFNIRDTFVAMNAITLLDVALVAALLIAVVRASKTA
jgi:hypothetical protein